LQLELASLLGKANESVSPMMCCLLVVLAVIVVGSFKTVLGAF